MTCITAVDLTRLRQAVAAVDFDRIKLDPARQPLSASDGGDATLELASPRGPQSIPLWQLVSPESLPVVERMSAMQARYARTDAPVPSSPAPSAAPPPDR